LGGLYGLHDVLPAPGGHTLGARARIPSRASITHVAVEAVGQDLQRVRARCYPHIAVTVLIEALELLLYRHPHVYEVVEHEGYEARFLLREPCSRGREEHIVIGLLLQQRAGIDVI